MRCQLILYLVLIFVLILFWSIQVYQIYNNPYFGYEYGLYYLLLIIPAIVGSILLESSICFALDTHEYRRLVPWSLLLVAISCFLIGIWVIVYISVIYEEPYVKIPRYVDYEDYDEYYQQSN